MNNIALFLDIDGVLNQYNTNERIARSTRVGWDEIMDPFPKKVIRLNKLIKKYNIDVYLFSAWTIEDLEPHIPFKILGCTRKSVLRVNNIAKSYRHSIMIEDEPSNYIKEGLEVHKIFQPYYEYGLVKKDFIKIDKHLDTLSKLNSF